MVNFRFGIIGIGAHANALIKTLLSDDQKRAEIIAICDLNEESMNKFNNILAKEYGHKAMQYTDYKDLMLNSDVDVVIISAPDFFHHEMALFAFKNQKHVFLEKPVGINLQQMIEIVQAAKKSGKILEIGYVLRYAPFYVKFHELISSQKIGRPLFVQALEQFYGGASVYFRGWWRFRKNHGGLMLTKISHDLDLMYWMFGEPEKIVAFSSNMEFKPGNWDSDAGNCSECKNHCPYYAKTSRTRNKDDSCLYNTDKTGADICDNAHVMVQFKNGLNLDLGMNFFNSHGQDDRFLRVVGSEAELTGRLSEQIIRIDPRHDKSLTESVLIECAPVGATGHGGGDYIQLIQFIDAISENRESKAGILSAYWSSILVMGAQLSVDEGRIISIKELTEKYPLP
jgi:predicted dehydrogenase